MLSIPFMCSFSAHGCHFISYFLKRNECLWLKLCHTVLFWLKLGFRLTRPRKCTRRLANVCLCVGLNQKLSACRDYAVPNLKESRGAIGMFLTSDALMFKVKRGRFISQTILKINPHYCHQWFDEKPLT